ncbi:MAG: hypothetical protein R2824_17480 [Saprospiraceae bacterium]|nr:hypothetical protein [Lewinella sp.]
MLSNRTQQLADVAYKLGLDFFPEDEWGLKALLEDFRLFNKGIGKEITNIMRGRDDLLESDLRIFDYKYVISTGNSSRRFRQTVFFMDSRKLGLPDFRMRPELFIHKVGALIGFEDIDFEEYPDFSNQYYLKSSDEYYLRASLKEGFFKFFSREKGWYLEGLNYYMIFYRKDVLFPPDKIRNFYRMGLEVFDLFKFD